MPGPPRPPLEIDEELVEEILMEQGAEQEEGDEESDSDEPSRRPVTRTAHTEYLEQIQATVKQQMASNKALPRNVKQPSCYLDGASFWMRAASPTFLKRRDGIADPYKWCRPDVFIWLPKLFKPSPALICPGCFSSEEVINGYPHPRRVVDLDTCYYIMTSQHRCKRCGSKFIVIM